MPRIAVILPDLLRRTGMIALLERYFSSVTAEGFDRFVMVEACEFDLFITDAASYAVGNDFFMPRRAQCLVLTDRPLCSENLRTFAATDPLETLLEALGALIESISAASDTQSSGTSDELSGRELQVLQLVVSGAINKEIADRLHISLNTVLTHRKNIAAKLGIKTISGLTLYALMHGYVSAEDIHQG